MYIEQYCLKVLFDTVLSNSADVFRNLLHQLFQCNWSQTLPQFTSCPFSGHFWQEVTSTFQEHLSHNDPCERTWVHALLFFLFYIFLLLAHQVRLNLALYIVPPVYRCHSNKNNQYYSIHFPKFLMLQLTGVCTVTSTVVLQLVSPCLKIVLKIVFYSVIAH